MIPSSACPPWRADQPGNAGKHGDQCRQPHHAVGHDRLGRAPGNASKPEMGIVTRVLYITRNGLLEPLGQSQVMAYLRGLSTHYHITLITFEKPEDTVDAATLERARQDCERHGICWRPQRFRRRPKVLAPVWSMVLFLWLCLREVRRGNAQLIHARSYIPAAVALVVWRITGTPFIFDMRALWPEELITAGRLRRGSLAHRAIVWTERLCLRHAAAVVSLTDAAVVHLRQVYPREMADQHVVVIPTCADLRRFAPAPPSQRSQRVYGCVGTVLSGWFRLDWLAAFFDAAARRHPDVELHIVTRDDAERVRASIRGAAAIQERLYIYAMPPQLVHEAVRRQNASAMFFTGGLSKLGSSPTRLAEVLGCGIPVVANSQVGDVARIIQEYRIGVLAEGPAAEQMEKALDDLEALLNDPHLPSRCRKAAEEHFSLGSGTAAYAQLYESVVSNAARQTANQG